MILRVRLERRADLDEWREVARSLVMAGIPPHGVEWCHGDADDLFGDSHDLLPVGAHEAASPRVPRAFLTLAHAVVCHADPERFAVLYRLLWRLQADPHLLEFAPDADVERLRRMEKAIRRDCHKMKAFVRFREARGETQARRRFVAWFEPDHHIVARTAPFFSSRFGDMDWMILTPKGSALYADGTLSLSDAPASPPDLEDETEALWTTYFASIFNPARLKVRAMQAEMPKKYWRNLPEAALIPQMIAGAGERVAEMARQQSRTPPAFHHRIAARRIDRQAADVFDDRDPASALARLRHEADGCKRCPLYANATQTIFGQGPLNARLMILGEQPGDHEDLTGRPFSGPAGAVLDGALGQAGIDRDKVWVTNAVKHFKFVARGKRRLHQRPNSGEIAHCRWWLGQEIALVQPDLILAMGATAVEALTGKRIPMGSLRGRIIDTTAGIPALVTWHPSYLLRLPDRERGLEASAQFVRDIALAAERLGAEPPILPQGSQLD